MVCAWRQYLQSLQKLDEGILIIWVQRLERLTCSQRLARMGQHGLAQSCELAMMKIGRLIGRAPQLAGDELAVPRKKPRRAWRLVHIQCLSVGIVWPGADIVQLEVGEGRDIYHPIFSGLEAWVRQFFTRQIDSKHRGLARPQVPRWIKRIRLRKEPALLVEW